MGIMWGSLLRLIVYFGVILTALFILLQAVVRISRAFEQIGRAAEDIAATMRSDRS